MQLNLKTILINGDDPDPKIFTIGFGDWPQFVNDVDEAVAHVSNIYCTDMPVFESYSITIQAPLNDTSVYINATGIYRDGDTEYLIEEAWEITPDETPVQE